MKFGMIIPNNWGLEDPQDVVRVATRAEELGFDSVWVNHHVFNVGYVLDRLGSRPYYDALAVLGYVAALTSRVRLGTSVLVLPYLNPMVLAKTLATLDVMSGGRVTVGVGVGALKAESDALGSGFTTRGAYANESISVMKALWTQEDPTFDGRFHRFSKVKFSPKPLQKPHLPIWIGGWADAALRRVVALGDGWHPNGRSLEELRSRVEQLRSMMSRAGRSMSEIALSVREEMDVLETVVTEPPGPMIGSPDQILASIDGYVALGVSELVLSVSTADVDRIHRAMDAFASRVIPRVGT
jgi:probable F420-dependent oxidoreductase